MACRAQPIVAAWTKNTVQDHFFKEAKKQGDQAASHCGVAQHLKLSESHMSCAACSQQQHRQQRSHKVSCHRLSAAV